MTREEAIERLRKLAATSEFPRNMLALMMGVDALREQEERENPTPLTLDELREMGGEPVWCADYQCYGIVKVETIGNWANKQFLVGCHHDYKYGVASNFEYDVKRRGLTLYRHKPREARNG